MLQDDLYTVIGNIELSLHRSLAILGCYCILKKQEFYNNVKALYDALPQELISSRVYLESQKEENIYFFLSKFSIMIDKSPSFLGFILVNRDTIMTIIDEIYATLPEDIIICRKIDSLSD